jgi:hypothetical protein
MYQAKSSINTLSSLVAQYKLDKATTRTGPTVDDASGVNPFGTLMNGSTNSPAADAAIYGPTFVSGSPVTEGRVLWVGTNDGTNDNGALTAISLDTDRRIRTITENSSYLPDNDISSISITSDGALALVGTESDGAWATGLAGFIVTDTATTTATQGDKVRIKSGGTVRVKPGGTVRVKPN